MNGLDEAFYDLELTWEGAQFDPANTCRLLKSIIRNMLRKWPEYAGSKCTL